MVMLGPQPIAQSLFMPSSLRLESGKLLIGAIVPKSSYPLVLERHFFRSLRADTVHAHGLRDKGCWQLRIASCHRFP